MSRDDCHACNDFAPDRCPEHGAAYKRARDRLVSDAAEASETFGDDELERFAAEEWDGRYSCAHGTTRTPCSWCYPESVSITD